MRQELETLLLYGEADSNKKLHLFLQYPDLRNAFQEIDRKKATAQMGKYRTESCPQWKSEKKIRGFLKEPNLNCCNL